MRYAVCLLFAFSALTLSLGGLSQASEEAGPDDPEEPKDQRQSVVLGVVSLKPKGGVDSLATGRFPWPPRSPRCPQWGEWENVTCWWPSISYDELPQSCTYQPLPERLPSYLKALVESKSREMYDVIVNEYERRGKPAKCGYCSKSFKCRTRNATNDDEDNSFEHRRHHPFGPFCPPKEIVPMKSECDDSIPCAVSKVNGGCPPPLFLNAARIDRIRGHIENEDHEQAAKELFASRNGPGDFNQPERGPESTRRKKRHASFEEEQPYDGPEDDGYGPRYQHDVPPFDDYGPPMRREDMLRYRDESRSYERNGEGPPDSERFRPFHDDAPPHFDGPGPDFGGFPPRRRGPPPHGPRPDGPPDAEFVPGPREGGPDGFPFGPGPFRPHGRRSFGPERRSDRSSSSSSSSESNERRPSHGHHRFRPPHHRRFPQPPPHHGGFPFPPPFLCQRRPWLPICRFGRNFPPPPHPPCGPFERCFPPFTGPGSPFDSGRLPMPSEAASGWLPPPPPPPGHRPFGPGPERHHRHAFIIGLLHGTTCASVKDSCLCCCGPYIPNIEKGTCEDLRELIPRIDDVAEALQKALGNPEEQQQGVVIEERQVVMDEPEAMQMFPKMEKPVEAF